MSEVAGKLIVKSGLLSQGFFPKFSNVDVCFAGITVSYRTFQVRLQTMIDLSRSITLGLICNKSAIGLSLEDFYGDDEIPKEIAKHNGYVVSKILYLTVNPTWFAGNRCISVIQPSKSQLS